MNKPSNYIKSYIQDINPVFYSPKSFRAKLDQNESPLDFSPEMKREVYTLLTDLKWSRFPVENVREKLSSYANWSEDNLFLGQDLTHLLNTVLACVAKPGQKVLVPRYTPHAVSTVCNLHQLSLVQSIPRDNFSLDVGQIIRECSVEHPDFILLNSPQDPLGKALKDSELQLILDSTNGLVIIDESHWEFAGSNHEGLLGEYSNLISLRSLSYSFGLGGANLGYIVAQEEFIQAFKTFNAPYQLGTAFSYAALDVALSHPEWHQELINHVITERQRLYYEMLLLPNIKPYPSDANFVFAQTTLPVEGIIDFLYKYGLLVCNLEAEYGIDQGLRLTIGTTEENNLFLDALYATGEET